MQPSPGAAGGTAGPSSFQQGGSPEAQYTPFRGTSSQQNQDGAPWRVMHTSPEHALLKVLPGYVSHLKPGLAAAVTQSLLAEAPAAMADMNHLPARVSATILKLVLAPRALADVTHSDAGEEVDPPAPSWRTQSYSSPRILRPAMSTGSISSAPGAMQNQPPLAHTVSYSPPQPAARSQTGPPSAYPPLQGFRLGVQGPDVPLQPRPSFSLRPGPASAPGPGARPLGLPPVPPPRPTSPIRRADSGPPLSLRGPPSTTSLSSAHLQPSSQGSNSPPGANSEPLGGPIRQPTSRAHPHSAPAAARLVSAVSSSTTGIRRLSVVSSQPSSASCSDNSSTAAFESASALFTTNASMEADVGSLPSAQPHSQQPPMYSMQTAQQQQQQGRSSMPSSAYHSAMGSDRRPFATGTDRSSVGASDRSSLISDRSSMPTTSERPSTASERSSLPERVSTGASERGSQISSRPSWETGSVSSRTSTVHGSASSMQMLPRIRKLGEPTSPVTKGHGGFIELPMPPQQHGQGTQASQVLELAAQGRMQTDMVVGSSATTWDASLAMPQMQTTLQALQAQSPQLLSALSVRPGRTAKDMAGPRAVLFGQSISETGAEDAERTSPTSASWPSMPSSNVSTPGALTTAGQEMGIRTFVDVGVQVGGPQGDLPGQGPAHGTIGGTRGESGVTQLAPEPAGSTDGTTSSGSHAAPEGTTNDEDEDSNPDEDVNKAVQLLLRRHYPRLASGLQGVLEATCSDAELLRLAAAARSSQPLSLELLTSTALQAMLVENATLKRRVQDLETRPLRMALGQSSSSSGAAPPMIPMGGGMHAMRSSSWKDTKSKLLRDTLSSAGREAVLLQAGGSTSSAQLSLTPSTRSSSSSAGVSPSIPLSLLLTNRLEGSNSAVDVGSARSSEAGTELTFAHNSSPCNSSSGGERGGSLTGTLRTTSSDGASHGPNSRADSGADVGSLRRRRGAGSASTAGTTEVQSLDGDSSGDRSSAGSQSLQPQPSSAASIAAALVVASPVTRSDTAAAMPQAEARPAAPVPKAEIQAVDSPSSSQDLDSGSSQLRSSLGLLEGSAPVAGPPASGHTSGTQQSQDAPWSELTAVTETDEMPQPALLLSKQQPDQKQVAKPARRLNMCCHVQ